MTQTKTFVTQTFWNSKSQHNNATSYKFQTAVFGGEDSGRAKLSFYFFI